MESLSPNIFVEDMQKTIAFYKVLGFEVVLTVPEMGTDLVWAMLQNGGVTMMFQTFESLENELPKILRTNGASQLLYIKLKNIHAFFDGLKDMVTILKPLETTFYGAIEFSIVDNNGYVLTFAEDVA
jgi:uncharacterized glyoxalase superfamily protein PhnB